VGSAFSLPQRNSFTSPEPVSRIGLAALALANLFVALQTVRHEWGYYEILLIFWTEVVVLGGYNVLRMLVVGVLGVRPLGSWAAQYVDPGSRFNRLIFTLIGIGFFIVKFGGFAMAIGLFVLLLPAMLGPGAAAGGISIHHALHAAGPGLLTATAMLCLSHGISFAKNFLLDREYDRVSVGSLMFWPYARMSLVGGVLLAGIVITRMIPRLGNASSFAVVMVLLKLLADALSHRLEHAWLAESSPEQPAQAERRVA
jgi:uncharacterized protein DUF6498